MSIYYPPAQQSQQQNTGSRSQYAIPATINTTFPIIISGSTSPQQIATIFVPPTFLYQMSGSYSLTAIGIITGAAGVTGSLEGNGPDGPAKVFLTQRDPFVMGINSAMADRFSGSSGYLEIRYPIIDEPLMLGVSLPVMFSGSVSDYTASIYGIYFSPNE